MNSESNISTELNENNLALAREPIFWNFFEKYFLAPQIPESEMTRCQPVGNLFNYVPKYLEEFFNKMIEFRTTYYDEEVNELEFLLWYYYFQHLMMKHELMLTTERDGDVLSNYHRTRYNVIGNDGILSTTPHFPIYQLTKTLMVKPISTPPIRPKVEPEPCPINNFIRLFPNSPIHTLLKPNVNRSYPENSNQYDHKEPRQINHIHRTNRSRRKRNYDISFFENIFGNCDKCVEKLMDYINEKRKNVHSLTLREQTFLQLCPPIDQLHNSSNKNNDQVSDHLEQIDSTSERSENRKKNESSYLGDESNIRLDSRNSGVFSSLQLHTPINCKKINTSTITVDDESPFTTFKKAALIKLSPVSPRRSFEEEEEETDCTRHYTSKRKRSKRKSNEYTSVFATDPNRTIFSPNLTFNSKLPFSNNQKNGKFNDTFKSKGMHFNNNLRKSSPNWQKFTTNSKRSMCSHPTSTDDDTDDDEEDEYRWYSPTDPTILVQYPTDSQRVQEDSREKENRFMTMDSMMDSPNRKMLDQQTELERYISINSRYDDNQMSSSNNILHKKFKPINTNVQKLQWNSNRFIDDRMRRKSLKTSSNRRWMKHRKTNRFPTIDRSTRNSDES
ncbi:hypothetical protein SNEBB_009833 [Seison nebaliae]|nr:hypothetical protein SNEBB_009833 [Seison nebaliae]